MGNYMPKFFGRFHVLFDWIKSSVRTLRVKSSKLALTVRYFLDRRPILKRFVLVLTPFVLLFFLLLLVVWIEIPSKRQLRNIQNKVASEVYSADSVLLGRYYIQDRTEVKYEEIAPVVIDALVSTEDERFFSHSGVDFLSLGRVLIKSIFLQDESSGGGSTITQQLAKNLYPRKRYWMFSMLINKMREVITAQRLEDIYDKKELLTLYLNTIPFSDNSFGIQTAANRFFSVSAKELTVSQAAVLVGTLKATTSYNPRLFPDRSQRRRNVVLSQMVKNKKLPRAVYDSLKTLPIDLRYSQVSHHEGLAPYFRQYLKTEIDKWCERHRKEDGSVYNLYTDGLKIYTTLDSRMQQYAENAVTQQMSRLQKIFYEHWGRDKPWKGKETVLEEAIRRTTRYKQLREEGLSDDDIIARLEKPIPMKVFTWDGVREEVISPIDSVIHHLQFLNAGFLAIDPASGQVKVWVGGIDHDFFQYDHVKVTTKRQVGSIFKPIVYAVALEQGMPPCEIISAGQQTYVDKEGDLWTPRNTQNDYEVDYTMRGALAYSVNTVAAKVIDRVGVNPTMELARDLGVVSEIPDVLSISLGSTAASLYEMTTVFASFANQGVAVEPYSISAIVDLAGNVFTDFVPDTKRANTMSPRTAQLMIQLLRTVVHEGTGSPLRWQYGIYTDVGGKTGTTQANADGWFMAITPRLAMGAWVGADDPRIRFRSTKLGQGSTSALPITGYFMQQLLKDKDFREVTDARFPELPAEVRAELDCDLYELNDSLQVKIEKSIAKRDSIIVADTTVAPPPETFLQTLYRRKLRIKQARAALDTASVSNLEPEQ